MLLGALVAVSSPVLATPLLVRQHDQGSTLEVPTIGHQPPNDDAAAAEIPNPGPVVQIPQRFAGCWTGEVSESDLTRVRMITTPMIGAWLTKQYRVCFEQGPTGLRATLVDSNVARHESVLEAKSVMTPVFASEGAITLSGSLRLVERSAADVFNPSSEMTGVVDERVRLEGSLDYSGVMRVRGVVKGYYNGRAWFLAAWTSDFQRQSSP